MNYIKLVIIIVLTIVLQLSFVEQFINTLFFINLPLLIILYYNWLSPTNKTYLFTIFMAWGQSYFDALPFGLTIILFFTTAIFIQRLSLTYLTNKTIGSLVIAGIVSTIIYTLLLTLIAFGQYGITLDFVHAYVLPFWTFTANLFIASLLLVFFKLTIFRHEISET